MQVLPENLDQMTACKYLNVNNNQLVRLPRCIGRMPNLVTLSAAKNQIAYIPQEVMDSKSLRAIRLSANLIRVLPEKIGEMKRLRELCLDYNRLAVLPPSIHKLTRLRILRIEGNLLLTDPPPDIIGKGAEGVVEYFRIRVLKDEAWRIRAIVTGLQDILTQARPSLLYPALSPPAPTPITTHIVPRRTNATCTTRRSSSPTRRPRATAKTSTSPSRSVRPI